MFKKLFSKNRNSTSADLDLNTQFVSRGITPLTGTINLSNNGTSTSTAIVTTTNWVNSSTSGFGYNPPKKLDAAPLRHYMKKWFPFIIDVLEVNIDSYQKGNLRISLLISPTHFAETFSNSGLDSVLKKKMNEGIVPLLKCMYEEFGDQEPTYLFFPQKTETILEYLK